MDATSVRLIRKVAGNIKADPTNAKFRKLKLSNAKVAHLWSNETLQGYLLASGWVVKDGELTLPETAESCLLADLLAGNPDLEAAAAVKQMPTADRTPAATASHPLSHEQAATPSAAIAEPSKAELKAAAERSKLLLNLKRQKAEKVRIKAQMEADRKQVACRKLKSSQSKLTNAGGGANVARYADIGVDLNSGGG